MTQTNHTPGPWSLKMTGWRTNPFAIYSPRRPGAVACVPSRTSVPLDEQDANARLIAAAPELLAVLEGMDEELSLWGADTIETMNLTARLDAIRAAIAKAKGE